MKLSRIVIGAMMLSFVGTACYGATKDAPQVPQGSVATQEAKPAPSAAGKGMVWANQDSKIFHKEGSKWYGKTKKGSYMTEAEAIKAGYREAKPGFK